MLFLKLTFLFDYYTQQFNFDENAKINVFGFLRQNSNDVLEFSMLNCRKHLNFTCNDVGVIRWFSGHTWL